jgi:hypothetical protein
MSSAPSGNPAPAPAAAPNNTGRSSGNNAPQQEGFTAKKRKAEEGTQADRNKQRRYGKHLKEGVLRELQQWATDVENGVAKGGDLPTGLRAINKAKKCMILTSSTHKDRKPEETAKLTDCFKVNFNLDSQSPEMNLHGHNHAVVLKGHTNFKKFPREGDVIFESHALKADELTEASVRKVLETDLKHLALGDEDVKKLVKFGTAKGRKVFGPGVHNLRHEERWQDPSSVHWHW